MRSCGFRGLVAGLAATSMALLATAAFGQTAGHTDPARDVVRMDEQDGSTVAAAGNKTADITHVRFAHTSRRVVATIRLRDYGGAWQYYALIKTPGGDYAVVGAGHRAKKDFTLYGTSETPIPCDGFAATVSRTKNTIRVSIPTSCLDRPRWVRMGVIFFVFGQSAVFIDDALRNGGAGNVGPRLTDRLFTT